MTFLVNFGVSIHSQDIDQHTPQELAAMNDCSDILRYLDTVASQQATEDPRKAAKLKEQAEKDAQKLVKNFKKVCPLSHILSQIRSQPCCSFLLKVEERHVFT